MSELRDYIRAILSEKIRSGYEKFDLRTFRGIDDRAERKQYADMHLENIGEGSSRAVYVLTSKKVLKIAIEDSGIGQNGAEIEIFNNTDSDIVTKVFEYSPDHEWIAAELVNPLEGHQYDLDELYPALGGFEQFVRHAVSADQDFAYIRMYAPEALEFAEKIHDVATQNDLMIGDLVRASSWGRGSDGRLVLLDYGYTDDVKTKYY